MEDFIITGKVLNKETGAGIPDLIVVFFDLDTVRREFVFNDNANDNISDDLWEKLGHDRIGSRITNARGSFSFNYNTNDFNTGDNEKRPDLILFVLVPEGDDSRLGTPSVKRIIYGPSEPILNAGRHEEFIIKISNKLLEKFEIELPVVEDVTIDLQVDNYKKAVESRLELHQKLNAEKKAAIKSLYDQAQSANTKANEFVSKLTGVGKKRREGGAFITAPEELENAQKKSIKKTSATTIKAHNNNAAASLMFTEHEFGVFMQDIAGSNGNPDLQTIKAALTSGAPTNIRLSMRSYCQLLHHRNTGPALENVRKLFDPVEIELKKKLEELEKAAEEETNDAAGDNGGTDGSGGSEGGETEALSELENLIKEWTITKVLELNHIPTIKRSDEIDRKESFKKALEAVGKGISPIDNTAIHDVHVLQIAFEEIWTEAFDEHLRGKVSDVYRRINQIENDNAVRILPDLTEPTDSVTAVTTIGVGVTPLSEESIGVPAEVGAFLAEHADIEFENWNYYDVDQQLQVNEFVYRYYETEDELEQLLIEEAEKIAEYLEKKNKDSIEDANDKQRRHIEEIRNGYGLQKDILNEKLERYVLKIRTIAANPRGSIKKIKQEMADLKRMLKEKYTFEIYAPGSTNVGIVNTYRQKWKPGDFQVANMVGSIPMAPGEVCKYTRKEVLKTQTGRKAVNRTAFGQNNEASYTTRAESEIMAKAMQKLNYSLGATASYGGGSSSSSSKEGSNWDDNSSVTARNQSSSSKNFNASLNTGFGINQESVSGNVKKSLREAIVKSAQEYKDEREVEVTFSQEQGYEEEVTGEIKNPNNELTVTYLFYELERQYRVSEHLYKVTPVVLVAQDVPKPNEIDEEWIIRYEWILRRELLDDMFNEALDFTKEGLVGDQMDIELKKDYITQIRKLIADLSDSMIELREEEEYAQIAEDEAQEFLEKAVGSRKRKKKKIAKISKASVRTEHAESEVQEITANMRDMEDKLATAQRDLRKSTEELAEAQKLLIYKQKTILQLQVHIKDNILHYMRGIWMHEDPDQRYFRLRDQPVYLPVPEGWVEPGSTPGVLGGDDSLVSVEIEGIPAYDSPAARAAAAFESNGMLAEIKERRPSPFNVTPSPSIKVKIKPPQVSELDITSKPLYQIAELDNLLGFKGNFMIFPLKECTYITNVMTQDYIDDYFGVKDPDISGNFTLEEILDMSRQYLNDGTITKDSIEWQVLKEQMQLLLSHVRKDEETVVVPTGQLFIEALVGGHSLVEPFKLMHRKIDVDKAQADFVKENLENLRKAKRIAADNLEDPEIDKVIEVKNNGATIEVSGEE